MFGNTYSFGAGGRAGVRDLTSYCFAVALLFPLVLAAASACARTSADGSRVPGEVIVGYSVADDAVGHTVAGAAETGGDPAAFARREYGLIRSESLRPGAAQASSRPATAGAAHRIERWVFAPDADIDRIIAVLRTVPGVSYAEPNLYGSLCYTPTDPLWSRQSGDLAFIGMQQGWQAQIDRGGTAGATSSVLVAVIDSGVEPSHPDLAGALDLADSYNFVENNTHIIDPIGHGTRVAGLIGAMANNGTGIAGVAFGCRIMSLDVATTQGTVTSARVVSALNWAVAHGARVVNMSLRFTGYSQALYDACDAAAASGAVLVAAVGNENQGDRAVYPACFDSVMGVAALADSATTRALWSNYNNHRTDIADLAAPGLTVFSTIPGWQYNGVLGSGTSYAAPLVSGLAGLLMAQNPGQSQGALRDHLKRNAGAVGSRPAYEPQGWAGAGRLDAQAALGNPMTPDLGIEATVIDDPTTAGGNQNGALDRGETVRLVLKLRNDGADVTSLGATLTTTDSNITIPTASATWPTLRQGQSADPVTAFVVTASPASVAHRGQCRLALSGVVVGGAAYTGDIYFDLQVENPLPVPTGGYFTPQTWTAGNTYTIAGTQQFLGGLTIQPGTILRVSPGADIMVMGGTLSAEGTTTQPIRLTSLTETGGAPWGTLRVDSGVTESTMTYCTVERGSGAVCYCTNSHFRRSGFNGHAGIGLHCTAGGEPITTCSAAGNAGQGILAPTRPLQWCSGSINGNTGLTGTGLLGCVATNNLGIGMSGATASDCAASSNALTGITCTGGASRCTAQDNLGAGIVSSGGPVTDCTAFRNLGAGISTGAGGGVDACQALENGVDGIDTGAATVTGSTADGNARTGIQGSGSTALTGCRISGNAGAAVQGVASLTDCTATDNGSGVSGVTTLVRCYVAQNGVSGTEGGTVSDSTVIGNSGAGMTSSSSVQNSWVMFNRGVGIDTPLGSVQGTSVRENTGYGVRNLPAPASGVLNGSNLYENGGYEYFDDRNDAPTGTSARNCQSNFWGTTSTAEMATHPFPSPITRIYDKYDSALPLGWLADYSGFVSSPVASAPDATPPAFLLHVLPDGGSTVTVGETTFTLVFSKPMDTSVQPTVTFGTQAPFTDNCVNAAPGWLASTVWQGTFWVQGDTGDGTNTLRVSTARDAGGFVIPDDTVHSFVIDSDSTGSLVANNGLATATGPAVINCRWGEDGKPSGALGYNLLRSTSGEEGTYQPVNTSLLIGAEFTDTGLSAGTIYFYVVDIVDSDSNSVQWTPPFYGVTQSSSGVGDWEVY